jgi:catechol 2,3-dioxygenase-like lactoylglutathione lyase family enzyme
MPDAMRPNVNGILETSLYVQNAAISAEFYERIFGFEPIATDPLELNAETRLCALRAGDRSVLLLFKRGDAGNTDATGSIHLAFAIDRGDLERWEKWLGQHGVEIVDRKTWNYGGQALYFHDPDGHLLEVVTPGVWSIY